MNAAVHGMQEGIHKISVFYFLIQESPLGKFPPKGLDPHDVSSGKQLHKMSDR